jgi:shikimate kinase
MIGEERPAAPDAADGFRVQDRPGVRPARLPERIVLVGFMGAGKSTVGQLLADRLGFAFVDLDAEAEERAGKPVCEIFADEGEAAFRALEAEVTEAADGVAPVVVASGGGWMARPELRDRWPAAVRVWLRVSPLAALERIGGDVQSRPMLDPASPEGSLQAILEARLSAYERAEVTVDTDGRTPAQVVGRILELLALA